jgi:hypothetical protein
MINQIIEIESIHTITKGGYYIEDIKGETRLKINDAFLSPIFDNIYGVVYLELANDRI